AIFLHHKHDVIDRLQGGTESSRNRHSVVWVQHTISGAATGAAPAGKLEADRSRSRKSYLSSRLKRGRASWAAVDPCGSAHHSATAAARPSDRHCEGLARCGRWRGLQSLASRQKQGTAYSNPSEAETRKILHQSPFSKPDEA